MYSLYRDLLVNLFGCGYSDLDKLENVMKIAKLFDVDYEEVIEEYQKLVASSYSGTPLDFNVLILCIMQSIIDNITETWYLQGKDDLAERLQEVWKPTINYDNSSFNLKSLDEYEGESKEVLLEKLEQELKNI